MEIFSDVVIKSVSWGLSLGLIAYYSGYSVSQMIHFFKAITK